MNNLVRIATWNVACGSYARYRCRNLDAMITALKQLHCDVILLQEVDKDSIRSGNRDITSLIADGLGMQSFFAPALTTAEGAYGNAVLSKFGLEDCTALQLGPEDAAPTWETENRSAACAVTTLYGQKVQIFSTHLASNGCKPSSYRLQQVEKICSYLSEQPVSHVLGGGDFNVYPHSPDLLPLATRFKNLTPDLGATCSLADEESLCFPIDHLYGSGFEYLNTLKLSLRDLSDHCLVVSDVLQRHQ